MSEIDKFDLVAPNLATGDWKPKFFIICANDGRNLLKIDLKNGTVEGELENTGEAARIFVKHLRLLIGEKA